MSISIIYNIPYFTRKHKKTPENRVFSKVLLSNSLLKSLTSAEYWSLHSWDLDLSTCLRVDTIASCTVRNLPSTKTCNVYFLTLLE
mgnify:CR=1 FL=1